MNIDSITHDTNAFRFELPAGIALDFLPGDHLMMHADIGGADVTRPYTPTSTPDDRGFFELIVKRYPTGNISRYLHSCKVGDEVLLEGPYVGGNFVEGMAQAVGLVAGGAGITPMISIIRTALRRGYPVNVHLLYANKTEKDIILREEFEGYTHAHNSFRCTFTLDNPPTQWKGATGFISEDMLRQFLPDPRDSTVVFLCGPPMMEFKVRQALLSLGYNKKQIIIP